MYYWTSWIIAGFSLATCLRAAHPLSASPLPPSSETSVALAQLREKSPPSLPRRTILLVIDGLAAGAIEKLPLVELQELKSEGTYYRELVLPLPAHPRRNASDENDPLYYPWSCSIPNPVMMTGTIFIGQPGIKETLLQHSYRQAGKTTAFLVNADAYKDIAGGYDTYRESWSPDDDAPVFPALQSLIEEKNPHFIRVHLQSPGAAGYIDQNAKRSIWDAQSEYRHRIIKTDHLVGEFIGWLKEKGHWGDTVLFICGDHGQADSGGHPPYELRGDTTSLLTLGKGIKPGVVLPYAEMVDVAPTIAYLQDVPAPRFSLGRILISALINAPEEKEIPQTQEKLNDLMRQHRERMIHQPDIPPSSSTSDFLIIEQIGTWHKRFRDSSALLKHQQESLKN